MHSNPSEFLSVEFFLSTFFVEFYLLSGAPDFSYFFVDFVWAQGALAKSESAAPP